jgi:hypothetical protein
VNLRSFWAPDRGQGINEASIPLTTWRLKAAFEGCADAATAGRSARVSVAGEVVGPGLWSRRPSAGPPTRRDCRRRCAPRRGRAGAGRLGCLASGLEGVSRVPGRTRPRCCRGCGRPPTLEKSERQYVGTMSAPPIDVSAGFLVGLVQRLRLWLGERTFVVGPRAWYVLVFGCFVAAGSTAATSGPVWLAAALGVIGVLAFAPARVWWRLRRPSALPIVFIARFGDESSAHAAIAQVHLDQLTRRLRRNPDLLSRVDLRIIRSPVTPSGARRILRHSAGRAVISGTGLVVADQARWEGWILLRWQQLNSFEAPHPGGGAFTSERRILSSAPSLARLKTDAQMPITLLTADVFPADHATGIEATVYMLTGTTIPKDDIPMLVPAMPLDALAVWYNSRAEDSIEAGGSFTAAALALEMVGDEHANHILLWNHCASRFIDAEQRESASPELRLRVARKGIAVAPDNAVANGLAGWAAHALGRKEDAVRFFEQSLASSEYMPGRAATGETLAALYYAMGNADAAVETLARAWAPSRWRRWRARRRARRMVASVPAVLDRYGRGQP